MNRYICSDFYDMAKCEAFRQWHKGIQEKVYFEYKKYNISDMNNGSDGFPMILSAKRGGEVWRTIINRRLNVLPRFASRIASFDYATSYELPKYYYYSNGSLPREAHRVVGWKSDPITNPTDLYYHPF
jgi:hypothetical protein